jgi:hypothetical protein
MAMKVICYGGARDGWVGTILHGSKLSFPAEPKADYKMTDREDCHGRRIFVPQEVGLADG